VTRLFLNTGSRKFLRCSILSTNQETVVSNLARIIRLFYLRCCGFTETFRRTACDPVRNGLRLKLKAPVRQRVSLHNCPDNVRQEFLETVSQDDFDAASYQ